MSTCRMARGAVDITTRSEGERRVEQQAQRRQRHEKDVADAEQRILEKEGQANVQNLLQNIRQPAAQQKIALPIKDGYEFVEVSHIIHCEAHGAYTRFFLDNKKQILVCRTLGDI